MKRLLLFLIFLSNLAYAQDKVDEQWYCLLLEGKTVGFLHQTTWQTSGGLIHSEIEQSMQIRRFGVPFSMTQRDVWIEDLGTGLISVSSELDLNGQRQRVEALTVQGGLRVQLSRGSQRDEHLLPVDNEPRGPHATGLEIAAAITGWNGREQRMQYSLFSPETLKIEEFRLRIVGPGEAEDSLGGIQRGILVEERTSALPGVVTTEIYDEQAVFLYSKTPVGLALEILRLEGDPNETVSSPKELTGEFSAVFDVASLTIEVQGLPELQLEKIGAVKVLFQGLGAAVLEQAVRAAEEELNGGGDVGSAPLRIVSSKKDARGEVTEVILYLENRPEAGVGGIRPPKPESTPPEVKRYLQGGFHLNLAEPRLVELLDRCRLKTVESIGVLCLESMVDRYIENKSLAYGFAGLDEILEGRAGDCTEHALLLAALLRKAGFPARLAYGLILTEIGFIGHAWVELFAGGSWHWLDPSFPGGKPYGFKIRLGVMDPGQPVWASLSIALLRVVGTVEAEILEVGLP
jgi:hypothetical protein